MSEDCRGFAAGNLVVNGCFSFSKWFFRGQKGTYPVFGAGAGVYESEQGNQSSH